MVVADPKVKNNQGIILPLITFGSIGLFCVFLFCIVRKYSITILTERFFNDIYSPRTMLPRGRPPKISNRLLSWVWVVFSTSESFLVNTVGLDGVMVPQQSPLLKVILGFTWLISFIAYGFIMIYYRRFITLKLQYDEYALKRTQLSKIEMRTVMVFGIPQDLRSEVNLAVYFENLGIGKVDTVVLCRNWSLLQRAVEKRAYFLRQLELLYVKCKKIPREYDSARNLNEERLPFVQRNDEHERLCSEILSHFSNISPLRRPKHRIGMVSLFIVGLFGLFGPLVDSVEFYCAEFKHWDKTVARIRKTPEKSKATAVALVTFESPISAVCVESSSTLINIIILQAVAVYPAQLLLAAPLILTWLSRLAPWANSTPREISNAYYPSILTCINYGIIYPLPILVFVVGLMYSAIAPATPYVVNRCLLGLFIMQLTMMGVLALKSVDDDNVRETSSEKAWSGYAQMVVGVAPLLFLTFFIANLLQQAYEKQIRNVPLEIIGEAQRHLLRTDFDIDSDNFTPYQPFSSVMNHRTTQDEPNGRELREIVTPVTGNPKLLNRLSTLSFSLLNRSPQREPEVHIELPTSSSSSVSSVEPQNSAAAEKRYSAITILQTHAHSGPSPFHDPNEIDPVLDLPGYSYEGLNTNVTSSRFVETPMTRVPGVLDTAVGAAMLRYGEQDAAASPLELSSDDDDCQLYSYLHPALIGKLPMPWYDGEVFEDLRRDQSRHQRLLVDKLQSRQRLSVHEELSHQDTTTSTNVSQVRGFFDGLTSWIHLTVS
ncbi:hypothetical protein HDV02_004508 [Globomyces sp. JEL0801]|nr:hypothetical protein HDV02_004508 [Globomyces sp. JEL0801]